MLGAGHFLFTLVKCTEIDLPGLGPFQTSFSSLGRVFGAGNFLSKFVFESIPKLIWRARISLFKVNFRALARMSSAGHFIFKVLFKST